MTKAIEGMVGEIEKELDEITFLPFVKNLMDSAKKTLNKDEQTSPLLFVIKGLSVYAFPLELPVNEIPDALTAIANDLEKIDAYVYITESWSLGVDSAQEAMLYSKHPDQIAENPFKDERIVFEASGYHQMHRGYSDIKRDERGEISIGNLHIDGVKMSLLDVESILAPRIHAK